MSEEKKYKVAIIGGGIAGITAAHELSKYDSFEITIFESNDSLGGLNQSIEIDNLNYDIGAFVYAETHCLFKTFPFLKDLYLPIIHYPMTIKGKNKYDVHPLSIKGYWKNFGTINFIFSIFSLFIAKIKYANYTSLPEYCKYFLGDRIYKKSGLQRYIKRLYKKEDVNVDIKLGYSRLRSLKNYSFRNIIKRFSKLDKDFIFNAKKRKCYVRPKSGFKIVFDHLEKHLLSQNVIINKNINIKGIQKKPNIFIIKYDNECLSFDRVISTIPFSITQRLIGIRPNFTPNYMKLLTLFYKGKCLLDSNVIYNYTNHGEWKRITVFSKYYGLEDNQDYFSVEITFDSIKDQTIEFYKQEFEKLVKIYSIAKNLSFQGSKIIPYAYPVFNEGETLIANKELTKIQEFGIDLVGRQGTFEYLSSDETMRTTQHYIRDVFL